MLKFIYVNFIGLIILLYYPVASFAVESDNLVKAASDSKFMYQDTAKKETLSILPTTGVGHIIKTVYRKRGADPSEPWYLNTYDARQEITYVDGLGRPVQIVSPKASSSLTDVVQPVKYDEFGREQKRYLPYTNGNDGSYKANALTPGLGVYAFYNDPGQQRTVTLYPYSETIFDKSPMNRIVEQGGVGNLWQPYNNSITGSGHTAKIDNETNLLNEVPMWTFNGSVISTSTSYPAGKLYKVITKNANWVSGKAGTMESFTDLQGRLVVKKVYESETVSHSTFYLYDMRGQIRYVIPPGVTVNSITIGDNTFNEKLYAYKYDERGRVIEKRMAGSGWLFVVYNELNLPVLSQDSMQRNANEWNYVKYDRSGRVILTGRYVSGASRSSLQAAVNASSVLFENRNTSSGTGYTSSAFPVGDGAEVYTFNFYDDYNLPSDCPWSPTSKLYSKVVVGLPTASKVKVLNSNNYLWSVNFYDDRKRLIEAFSQNLLGGYDNVKSVFKDEGELLSNTRIHVYGTDTTTLREMYDYDHAGRITRTRQIINNQPEIVSAAYEYNEIGEVIRKKLHSIDNGSNFLQILNYQYNTKGQLKSINDIDINSTGNTKFGMRLLYEDAPIPQYAGNIGQSKWKVARSLASPQLGYDYQYDKLSRLSAAESITNGSKDKNYSEYVTHDPTGNIQTMGRYALIGSTGIREQIDSLHYTYNGNRHTRIDDLSNNSSAVVKGLGFNDGVQVQDEYLYDGNGRLISDLNTGISTIAYNAANLPKEIIWSGGTIKKIENTYTANGNKLQKKFTDGSSIFTTNYIAGLQYTTIGTGQPQLEFIKTSEGRARYNGSSFIYEYDLKDNLGNVRATIDAEPSDITQRTARIIQENSYYPFGMVMPNANINYTAGAKNNYLYNGKELQEELGQLDYGARFYDPAIGRWSVPDPLAESHYDQSAYNYVLNNPIMFIDPLGLKEYDPNDLWGDNWKKFDTDKDKIGLKGVTITDYDKKLDQAWNERLAGREGRLNSFLDLLNGAWDSSSSDYLDPVLSAAEKAFWAQWDRDNLKLNNSPGISARSVLEAVRESDAWNSTIARAIVPDVVTLSGSINMVAGLGLGGSLNVTLITRGQDAGVHLNSTASLRVGVELGASINVSDGWSRGNPRNATYNNLMGLGTDVSVQAGAGIGAWGSFADNFSRLNYGGITVGVGPGVGASIGISETRSGWW